MKSILYQLQNGHVPEWEQHINETTDEINVNNKILEERDYFSSIMSVADFKRFQDLEDLYNQSNSFDDTRTFARGFRLGAKIMCAIFMGEGSDFR